MVTAQAISPTRAPTVARPTRGPGRLLSAGIVRAGRRDVRPARVRRLVGGVDRAGRRSTNSSRGRGSANCCVNTVGLVVVTVPICIVLGVGAAWLVERTDVPGRAVWRPLFVAPLAVPAFINSYAWVSVDPDAARLLGAGVLVATLSYFPFVYVPAAATLRRLDPAIEESARALGLRPGGVFFRVVLPQLRLAVLGGGTAHRRAPARRVRRVRDAALLHVHHRDLRAVPGDVQRRGGQHAGRRAGAAVPGAPGRRGGRPRQRPVRQDRLGRATRRDADIAWAP